MKNLFNLNDIDGYHALLIIFSVWGLREMYRLKIIHMRLLGILDKMEARMEEREK